MVLGKNENLAVLGQNLTKDGNQGNLMGPDIGIVTNARESFPKADSKLKTSKVEIPMLFLLFRG